MLNFLALQVGGVERGADLPFQQVIKKHMITKPPRKKTIRMDLIGKRPRARGLWYIET